MVTGFPMVAKRAWGKGNALSDTGAADPLALLQS